MESDWIERGVLWSRFSISSSLQWLTYLYPRIIWAPSNKGDLAPLALPGCQIIIKIIHRISRPLCQLSALRLALRINQFLAELVPVSVSRSRLDDDGLVVVGEAVDDVFDRLAKLELVEGGDALGCDLDSVTYASAGYQDPVSALPALCCRWWAPGLD